VKSTTFLCTALFTCLASVALAGNPATPAASLEAFLDQAPTFKDRRSWITGDGKSLKFAQWTAPMKARLEFFYTRLLANERDLAMHAPTEEQIDSSGSAFFTSDQAFDIYAAHVAHVLYVEAKHLVPWSIQNRPAVELDVLLASPAYFARIRPSARTDYPAGIKASRDFTEAPENHGLGEWLGDPRIGYDFLAGKTSTSHKRLIGKTEIETLVNLTVWMRDNLDHGPLDDKKIERAKSQRWLDDRLRAFPGQRTAIAIEGCHSAAKRMVDLARSVNVPLLNVQSQEDEKADSRSHFFNRSHGGLLYGWGGAEPRILWHTDTLYARAGRICFPIDDKTGTLLSPEQADQRYFDETWVSPETLAKSGFVYHLERVVPEKGFGHNSRGKYEDRFDYGWMIGYFKKKGSSKLDLLFDIVLDANLCSYTLLERQAKHPGLDGSLVGRIKQYLGDFTEDEVPLLKSAKEQSDRAATALKAIGGPEKFAVLLEQLKAARGQNLLPPR